LGRSVVFSRYSGFQ